MSFFERYLSYGWSKDDIPAKFRSIVDQNRSTCIKVRGEWCVPRFMGMERRVRQRTSDILGEYRDQSISEPEELQRRWQAGQEALARYRSLVQNPMMTPEFPAPETLSRPENQPPLPLPPCVLHDAIQREVVTTI